jgi:hypothetical protein
MGLFTAKDNAVLDWLFGSGSPSSYDLALSRTQPSSDGSNITEPDTGAGYARASITNNATNFPAAVAGTKTNGTDFSWPTATADWGGYAWSYWVLYDHSSGLPVIWGTLTTGKFVETGDTLRIPSGQMNIQAA